MCVEEFPPSLFNDIFLHLHCTTYIVVELEFYFYGYSELHKYSYSYTERGDALQHGNPWIQKLFNSSTVSTVLKIFFFRKLRNEFGLYKFKKGQAGNPEWKKFGKGGLTAAIHTKFLLFPPIQYSFEFFPLLIQKELFIHLFQSCDFILKFYYFVIQI